MVRESGVLMHVTSLASKYGIGTMGEAAYQFADFLHAAGQSCWQMLPLGPTSYGDSPYQSFSTFAGNPYLIDLDLLREDGLLREEEYASIDWGEDAARVDYGKMYQNRFLVLRKACRRLLASPPADYDEFLKQNDWLEDYALYMTIKDIQGGKSWTEWEDPYRLHDLKALEEVRREHKEDIDFWNAVQYLFLRQWKALKKYVNGLGIRLIGDIPIYVSMDSVDVWAHPEQYQLDADLKPVEISGCPPDSFSAIGQIWGNPLYNWVAMAEDGFRWWIRRIDHWCRMMDVIRIDHFRGFAGYFAIPFGADTAAGGHWKKGPGMELFDAVRRKLGESRIIAEDLGFLTDDVHRLRIDTGFPGMKIIEFAFDTRDSGNYFPYTYPAHSVCYTGTHDNEPVMGWIETAPAEDVSLAKEYLNLTEEEGYNWGMMRAAWASESNLAIVQAQDLLGLGHESRMNTPSTSKGNWCWRAKPGAFTPQLAAKLRHKTKIYGRLPE